ncbi:MAG: sigma-70 family RNA polymerase sigma factor [Bacilli bacterium]|nr:sigma-70 family RNA polymerase sigma factor [Bacilli bacterium]
MIFPKRRIHKDNPYKLIFENNNYMVIFIDSTGKKQKIKIEKEVYQLFDKFELEDLKEMNEFDRHIEHLEYTDESLYIKAINKNNNLEDIVISKMKKEQLKRAIEELPDIQKRRIKKYYLEEMTLKEISVIEKCSIRAIKYSIDIAIENIKKNMS